MVTKIPNKLYPMESKYKIIKENAGRYRKGSKKLKKISGAAADRILKDYIDKWKIKKKYKTNPYSSLIVIILPSYLPETFFVNVQ